jgi:hypothetical protein
LTAIPWRRREANPTVWARLTTFTTTHVVTNAHQGPLSMSYLTP